MPRKHLIKFNVHNFKKCISIWEQKGTFQFYIVYLHKSMLNGNTLIALPEFRSKTRMSVVTSSVQRTEDPSQCNKAIKNNKIYKGWEEKNNTVIIGR